MSPPNMASSSENALPSFARMARIAGIAISPFVALCLIGGKVWLALSLMAGVVLSLAVCGMLYLFVNLGMASMVAGLQERSAADRSAQTMQFILALFAKFLVLAGVGYAVMTLHSISLPAILTGFIVAQTAIVLTATRHWNSRRSEK